MRSMEAEGRTGRSSWAMLTNLGESGSTPWYLNIWGSSGFRVYRVEGLGGGLGNWISLFG